MNEDNKGYGCFVMLVSGLAMLFSVVALLKHDDWNCEISPAGFVIATLSALITFVVAWQIWQTISSREQLNNLDAKIDAKTKHAIHINLYHVFLFQGINARDCLLYTSPSPRDTR